MLFNKGIPERKEVWKSGPSEFSMHLDSIFRIQELLKTLNGFLKWEGKLLISASTGSSLSGAPSHSTALCSLLRLCGAAVELFHLCKEPEVRDGRVLVIESLTATPTALNVSGVKRTGPRTWALCSVGCLQTAPGLNLPKGGCQKKIPAKAPCPFQRKINPR